MHEIKFRGRRLDNGEWVSGYLHMEEREGECYSGVNKHLGSWLIPVIQVVDDGSIIDTYPVDPATVGQYTGLKGKNGAEICEGDIVKENRYEWISAYEVVYDDGAYKLRLLPGRELFRPFSHRNVVIGNIHDNPELLGGGHD